MPGTTLTRIALALHPRGQLDWQDPLAPALRWLIKERRAPIPAHALGFLLQQGGELGGPDAFVRAAAHPAPAGPMRAWALSYEWDEQFPNPRRWRADVGLQIGDDALRFSLVVRYGLPLGYLGPQPPPPPRGVPPLVGEMLGDGRWRVPGVGLWPLAPQQSPLQPARANTLVEALVDPRRRYPIVYLSCPASGRLPVEPARLAAALAGSAVVLVAAGPELDAELDWLLPPAFGCVGGALRLYLPGVRPEDEGDSLRHRYLEAEELAASGESVPAYLAEAVVRWADDAFRGWLTTPEDVQQLIREERLATLRAREQSDAETLREYIGLLEEENRQLQEQLRELGARFDAARAEIARVEELKARTLMLSLERDRARQTARRAEAAHAQAESQMAAVLALRELPDQLPALLDLLAQLFPARVVVTPRARQSAEESALERSRNGRLGWKLLHALATTLYDLVFADGQPVDIEAAFQRETGIEIAFGEGKQTNRNHRMMAQRRDVDDRGQPIDITPHLKLGDRPPKQLRVHFAIDRPRRLLVIGHCGDHLETFGTRWSD